jgi:sulfotransferase
MNRLHFCGGLPRTGSTVLMNILQQNPNIFTTGTCALTEIITSHILIKSRYRESFQAMSVEQADKAMYGLIHGATKGWFEALTDKPTVISKNRGWSNVFHLYPNSKYIAMVRDLRDIIESFERVNENTLALHSYGNSGTVSPAMHVWEKYDYYFRENNAFSDALNIELTRLMQTFIENKGKVIFIRYEDFTLEPITMIRKIYNFLEEDLFEHDLNNIEQSYLYEHDHAYFRERTDHKTKPKFRYHDQIPKRKLPEKFHERIVKEHNWFYEAFYPESL